MGDFRGAVSRAGEETGQSIVLVVLALVPLIAMIGIVIDLGFAYRTQRALQATADAAALAGAQALPDPTTATFYAKQYGGAEGGKNAIDHVTDVETITTKCMPSIPGCNPVNSVSVDETATVPTFFAKIFGVNSIKVHAKAAACSPCSGKPADIMLVLDRTGSMCQDSAGNDDHPACTDLTNAKNGIKTFLSFFDPSFTWVGLAVLPPAPSVSKRCNAPASYDSSSSPYVIVPLSHDYRRADGTLDPSSNLVSTLNCVVSGGSTSYANAIEAAQAELDAHGRADIPDVIVFLSDGAANTGPTYYSSSSPYRKQPCHQGVTSAGYAKAKGTTVYSIGYALDDDTGGCKSGISPNPPESPTITVYDALRGIASTPDKFLVKPDPGQLQTIYTTIAADISRGMANLIQ